MSAAINKGTTAVLAEWAASFSLEDAPAEVVERMKALVAGWRKVWGQGDFPFYFVQIAPYIYANQKPDTEPEIWI